MDFRGAQLGGGQLSVGRDLLPGRIGAVFTETVMATRLLNFQLLNAGSEPWPRCATFKAWVDWCTPPTMAACAQPAASHRRSASANKSNQCPRATASCAYRVKPKAVGQGCHLGQRRSGGFRPTLEQLGKQLKTACGTGGTVKDGVIEVQGDHVEKVMAALQKLGHKVKRAGAEA